MEYSVIASDQLERGNLPGVIHEGIAALTRRLSGSFAMTRFNKKLLISPEPPTGAFSSPTIKKQYSIYRNTNVGLLFHSPDDEPGHQMKPITLIRVLGVKSDA